MSDYEAEVAAVRERINRLLKDRGITQNAVAAGNAPAQKRINSQLSHGATISVDTLLRVLTACPDVSADWLLRGAGEIRRDPEAAAARHAAGVERQRPVRMQSDDFMRQIIAEKDRQIHSLLEILKK